MFIPRSLYYTKDHLWLRKIGSCDFYIGITDYAQKEIGKIDSVELKLESNTIKKDETWGTIYGTNKTFTLISPLDCEITVTNCILEKNASHINTDSYYNWLLRVVITIDNSTFLTNEEYIQLTK
ncbi:MULTISPECIES: glycine cleavage system protein H [unclassified Flavobacterium]|jgi:glycine cleavage system H protein|uniref:glycine cleavage system protein H n=1 Tax=unclassified Flavobacterium TaxID=196869 RepID=UPI00057D3142|nr:MULTISPECIES: glycine cleavage system protein H [unclassified Flavobacterium]KIA97987.1 glycine cleavage system protein H [Flavobacterium sp. JRM]MEA9413973.1 glycine cleavage system protein H [Flavobacterium sp. PL02]OUL62952.1 glycine cleavage system protein H [Flavobacterium sp. AJR]